MRTAISGSRLSSLQEIVLAYRGVPPEVRHYAWLLVHRRDLAIREPIDVPLVREGHHAIMGGYHPHSHTDPALARIHPGRPDRHAGWCFQFGFHSRARVAVLFIEE